MSKNCQKKLSNFWQKKTIFTTFWNFIFCDFRVRFSLVFLVFECFPVIFMQLWDSQIQFSSTEIARSRMCDAPGHVFVIRLRRTFDSNTGEYWVVPCSVMTLCELKEYFHRIPKVDFLLKNFSLKNNFDKLSKNCQKKLKNHFFVIWQFFGPPTRFDNFCQNLAKYMFPAARTVRTLFCARLRMGDG